MSLRTFVIVVACVAIAACGRRTEEGARPADAPREAAESGAHTDEANTVEVDERMLRDLRITTRGVESRPGGERVVLLGALAVDQSAYAEVGTPVAARVTRLRVNAGDTVSRGQVLADL